jgi:spore coat polysaccharide biosynthesis protein SpsF
MCSFAALENAWRQIRQTFHCEHVIPYLYDVAQFAASPVIYWQDQTRQRSWEARLSPRGFRLVRLQHHLNYDAQRRTMNTVEDPALLRQSYTRFELRDDFTWLEVLALLQREPGPASLNRAVRYKDYRAVDECQFASPTQGLENDPDG